MSVRECLFVEKSELKLNKANLISQLVESKFHAEQNDIEKARGKTNSSRRGEYYLCTSDYAIIKNVFILAFKDLNRLKKVNHQRS